LFSEVLLNDDELLSLRIAAARAMGEYGNPKAVKHLTKVLADHERDELGIWAALGILKLTTGPVHDEHVIGAIKKYESKHYEDLDPALEERSKALENIAVRNKADELSK
jgi:HEAT repeat protein